MDRELTHSDFYKYRELILSDLEKKRKRGQYLYFNGVGGAGHWSSRIYKLFLKGVFERDKSLFYGAAVGHDFQYFRGSSIQERKNADYQFLSDMFDIIKDTPLKFKLGSKAWALILFFIVRIFGSKQYNFSERKKVSDLLNLIEQK